MGFEDRGSAREHAVQDGESFDALASANDLGSDELALFNWGVFDSADIAFHLFFLVGARASEDPAEAFNEGASYSFGGSDAERGSGQILIPRRFARSGLAPDRTHTIRVRRAPIAMRLYVDANRDGEVDTSWRDNQSWEWGADSKGAMALVNNDDDEDDDQVDHADDVVNADNDPDELSPLTIRRFGPAQVPAGWEVELEVSDPQTLRIFDGVAAGAAEIVGPGQTDPYVFPDLSDREFEFGMEATRYVGPGDPAEITIVIRVKDAAGTVVDSSQAVVRVAPWIMPNHMDAAETVYVVDSGNFNDRFRRELSGFVTSAGCDLEEHPGNDVWMQDCMEWGFSNHAATGFRTVTKAHRLRALQTYPETLLDPDLGYHDPEVDRPTEDSTFDSTGNLECTPPGTDQHNNDYPWGRIYYGPGRRGEPFDAGVRQFLHDQIVQAPIEIDTSWLAVGHVDEIMTFVPDGPDSYKLLLASPDRAYEILRANRDATQLYTIERGDNLSKIAGWVGMHAPELYRYDGGTGRPNSSRLRSGDINLIYPGEEVILPASLLRGREFPEYDRHNNWVRDRPAEVSIAGFLDEGMTHLHATLTRALLESFNTQIQARMDAIALQLGDEIGVEDDQIVQVPILFMPNERSPNFADAITAGMVNMLVINSNCIVPKPFGPVVADEDLFEEDLLGHLEPLGLTVEFLDDWYEYHVNLGEVHCGSNTLRTPDQVNWWEYAG